MRTKHHYTVVCVLKTIGALHFCAHRELACTPVIKRWLVHGRCMYWLTGLQSALRNNNMALAWTFKYYFFFRKMEILHQYEQIRGSLWTCTIFVVYIKIIFKKKTSIVTCTKFWHRAKMCFTCTKLTIATTTILDHCTYSWKIGCFGPIFNFKVFHIIIHVFIPETQVHSSSVDEVR